MFKHYSTYQWDDNSEKLTKLLSLDKTQGFLFANLDAALFELSFGLAINFPHKKKCIYTPTFGSHFYNLITKLVKYDFKLIDFNEPDLENKVAEYLFSVSDLDNPITGELNNNHEKLKGKNIYRILINHNWHKSKGLNKVIEKRDCELNILEDGTVLALLGEKFQYTSLYANTLNLKLNSSLLNLTPSLAEDKNWVNIIESTKWKMTKPWFNINTPRIFDRAVLEFENQNGELVVQDLIKKHQLTLNDISAVNFCTQDSGFQPKFFNDPRVRGLVIISVKAKGKI